MLVEQKLLAAGRPAYVPDGTTAPRPERRSRLPSGRPGENPRRLAHIATLLADSGRFVPVPAISPLEEHHELARWCTADRGFDFFEVLAIPRWRICERRDPKGPLRQFAVKSPT